MSRWIFTSIWSSQTLSIFLFGEFNKNQYSLGTAQDSVTLIYPDVLILETRTTKPIYRNKRRYKSLRTVAPQVLDKLVNDYCDFLIHLELLILVTIHVLKVLRSYKISSFWHLVENRCNAFPLMVPCYFSLDVPKFWCFFVVGFRYKRRKDHLLITDVTKGKQNERKWQANKKRKVKKGKQIM